MIAKKLMTALLLGGVSLAFVSNADVAFAQKRDKKEATPPPPAPDPPVSKKAIALPFASIGFGLSPSKLADEIDKIIDEDYKATYKVTSPGVKMKALDAQVAEEKSIFRRSKVDFGKTPTGLDSTPLKGEFTYNNKEAVMTLTRNGETTYFFFIQDKMYKIVSEKTLSDTSALGKNYNDAVLKVATAYGVPGRILPADSSRAALEVDWKDSNVHIRLVQRSEKAIAYIYEDLPTIGNLASMRTAKPTDDSGIDPAVAAAMRKEAPPDPPKTDPKKKK